MKLLVTGHKGFVGSIISASGDSVGLISAAGELTDLCDPTAVLDSIAHHRPDAVIHLAAQTFIPDAFADPVATYQANILGTHNLLAALKAINFKGRFLFVSSSDVYGQVEEADLPTTERTPLKPLNPYAVSKIAGETLCDYWVRAEGFDIVIARPFNHIGPGQSPRFAIADFSRTIIEIKLGLKPNILKVGDLDVTRDFTDARDVVLAYQALLARGIRGGIYNVCSGVERHLGDAITTLAELAGVELDIQTDPTRFRKASHRRALGSSEKLHQHTGWQPKIGWKTSLQDTLTYWEATLR